MTEGEEATVLQIEKVSKVFRGIPALKNVDLTVEQGNTHALIGTSGSGKTTLLRIMLGLVSLDTGWVKINGQPLSTFTPRDWSNQIGYVPQDGGLFPHMTIFENVTLIGKSRNLSNTKIRERVDEILPVVEMDSQLLRQYPRQLSGGQKQRASMMRAIFLDPQILLLDEPMGALDPMIRQTLQIELKKIFESLKKTVLIVTHDLSEAVFLAQKMTLLHQGRVVQTGTYSQFVHSPSQDFVTSFLSAQRVLPAM